MSILHSELESEVEMVRLDVIQRRQIGSTGEVQSMNSQMAIISRQIADLRSKLIFWALLQLKKALNG